MDPKTQQRPQHRRNASSKTGIWKSLVSPTKTRPDLPESEAVPVKIHTRTQSIPLLPSDHPHASDGRILGERQLNAQSRPPSDKAQKVATVIGSKSPKKTKEPKKTKSSTNLSSVFSKINRSHKDLHSEVQKNKENTTPPVTPYGNNLDTPIWAQFATRSSLEIEQSDKKNPQSNDIQQEIAKYTPQEYSPGKQRNFNGTYEQPALRPTLNSYRPQSGYNLLASEGIVGAISRRVSGGRSSFDIRRSSESSRSQDRDHNRRASGDKIGLIKHTFTDRKVSGSSTEQAPVKDKLNIAKRGGRVMAAVAALQGKTKETPTTKDNVALNAEDVDEAFEAVLDARNIPEPMRQKMRTLTLRVKADFVKQDQEQSKTPGVSLTEVPSDDVGNTVPTTNINCQSGENGRETEEDGKSSKRSRARSRTFTFSKGDKRNNNSPTKRKKSGDKSRPTSVHIPKEVSVKSPSTPSTPTRSRSGGPQAFPITYIDYLRKTLDPTKVEVGRLHKLRILLRNETVTWVNSFVSQGGMTEIVGLLNRTMAIEWREDHEDQVLHEALLCLKALCTAECALVELDKVADELFPALIGMLFDDEKKGPAEYSTRTIIINVLFNFLAAATTLSPSSAEARARRILRYLGEPPKPEDAQPVDFVLGMHVPRPYKLWCREVTHVTKEVFWIFLHHMNIVPSAQRQLQLQQQEAEAGAESSFPVSSSSLPLSSSSSPSSYLNLHFPRPRPPVPAAPYIGGVEWDATTYLTSHLDLMNGLIACIRDDGLSARNSLRSDLLASGFEKLMGGTLRTCKEKFYSGVHDGLKAWVAAAETDGWETRFVREGPTEEERAARFLGGGGSPKKGSPKKKTTTTTDEGGEAPRLGDLPVQESMRFGEGLGLGMGMGMGMGLIGEERKEMNREGKENRVDGEDENDDDQGWIG